MSIWLLGIIFVLGVLAAFPLAIGICSVLGEYPMAWFEDLSPCDYFGPENVGRLRAVGWLSRDQAFSIGPVEENVFRRLCELTQDPWTPWVSMGVHSCEFCRFTGGGDGRFESYTVFASSRRELFIPGDGFLYVAPENITHYIDSHGYAPPEVFCRAVLECPPMRSMEYLKRLAANGGNQFARRTKP